MKKILQIFLLSICSKFLFAQGVCSKSGIEVGGFTFVGTNTGCSPLSVQLTDNSGGTNIQYIYDYKGEDPSLFNTLQPDNLGKFIYLSPGTHTILQYGKKNGKDMYACNTVEVLAPPQFSYSSCGGNTLTIIIPKNKTNDLYDSFVIDWGNGIKETVTSVPFSNSRSMTGVNQTIKVDGFKAGVAICPASPVSIDLRKGGTIYPLLTKVSLSSDGKEATIELTGGKDVNYILKQKESTATSYPSTGTTVQVGSIKMPISDTTKSYCFRAEYVQTIGCGTILSDEICTIILKDASPSTNGLTNSLSWTSHISRNILGFPKITPAGTYTIIREENGTKTNITATGQQYDDAIDCQKKYCYQIQLAVSSDVNSFEDNPPVQATSLSQRKCIDRTKINPPALTIGLVSVNDKNAVEMQWTDDLNSWKPKRNRYVFYRADNKNGKFEKIDSLALPKYTDTKIDASQQQYCYEVGFVDECASESKLSAPFCTVLLNEKNNILIWTSEKPFEANISKYEVEYFDEISNLPSVEATKSPTETTHPVDLTKFQEEAKYRIKTTSSTGEVSYSNIYKIPIKVSMLFTEAFTPNGDGKNEYFVPVGKLLRIKTFTMIIYNRWGNVVSVIHDIHEGWGGNLLSGEKAPAGIYAFKAEATLDDETSLTRYGKVLLLR